MQFIEFRSILKNQIIFTNNDIEKLIRSFNTKNLINWQKKGYIQKLRNSLYCFSDIQNSKNELFSIANRIYKPSYISLETALSYYGFIPEGVFSFTSISTLKTNTFNNHFGTFLYKSIKNDAFFAYKIIENKDLKFKIAEPEKAILDYFYLNHNINTQDDFFAIRFNKSNIKIEVDFEKMEKYAVLFNSKILLKKINNFNKYINA
jgi:predicted transcriptional regulator of viral defense system